MKLDKYMICPIDFTQVTSAVVWNVPDDYGRRLRSYICHCNLCDSDFEVQQFAEGDRWKIHKFRQYIKMLPDCLLARPLGWKEIQSLPMPDAAVVTGPGGDFQKSSCVDKRQLLKERMQQALKLTENQAEKIRKVIGELAE